MLNSLIMSKMGSWSFLEQWFSFQQERGEGISPSGSYLAKPGDIFSHESWGVGTGSDAGLAFSRKRPKDAPRQA